MDGGEILESWQNITAATNANPCVITCAGHGYNNGDDVYIKEVSGITELNGRTFRVTNKTANTFELYDYLGNKIDSSTYGAYTSGGKVARIYTISSPYDESDIFDLNYAQSNDVLTITSNKYATRDLTRTSHTSWTLTTFDNRKGPFRELNTSATTLWTNTGKMYSSAAVFDASMVGLYFYLEQSPNDTTKRWEVNKVIVLNDERVAGYNYYKALGGGTTGTYKPDHTEGTGTDGDPGVTWRYLNSGFGIVKVTAFVSSTEVDIESVNAGSTDVDHLTAVPSSIEGGGTPTVLWAYSAWNSTDGYPQAVAYHKQRFWLAGSIKLPNGLWVSQVGGRKEFGASRPILDDDAISLQLDSTEVNAIRHLVPMRELVVLTNTSAHVISGASGLILATDTPITSIEDYNGAAKIKPVIIGNYAFYVDDYQNSIRAIKYSNESGGFSGAEVSAKSNHLFKDKTIVDWAYQKQPYSIIWAVMSDGSLCGFTFMEDRNVAAFHRHETDGVYESVSTIREGNETAVYYTVKRVINGNTVRYIERMATRNISDIRDSFFVHCGLSYDGRNTGSTTMTITGGTTWDVPETLTLTASSSTFKSSDVGDQVVFRYTNSSGQNISLRCTIVGYTSGTVVSVMPNKLVDTSLRSTATTTWEFARSSFRPLEHLEGKSVKILADGNVVYNKTVSNGKVTLDVPAAVVHIGLGYESDLETLDIAKPQGQLKSKTVNVSQIFLTVQESRGISVGVNGFSNMTNYSKRSNEHGYDFAIPLITDVYDIIPNTKWSKKGRVCIRQTDPLPITVNCITTDLHIGGN